MSVSLEETDNILKDLGFDSNLKFDKLSVTFEVDFEDTNFLDVEFGTTLKLEDVQSQPEIKIPKVESSAYVTLAMVDPDAPSRKNPISKVCLYLIIKAGVDVTATPHQ